MNKKIPNNEIKFTMRAQMPLSLKAESSLLVKLQSNSTAPDSTIGSLDGENSNNKLHSVDDATAKMSSSAFCNNFINGFHTE